MARVPQMKYAILNVIAAIVWATSIAGIGYCFAGAIESASGGVQIFQKVLLALVGFGAMLYFYIKNNKKQKN
jgi:membrane protein DedA with SNARE-associated domain